MKYFRHKQWMRAIWIICFLLLSGCSRSEDMAEEVPQTQEVVTKAVETESIQTEPMEPETSAPVQPTMVEVDWSDYFDGLNGAAVFYEADKQQYKIYNQELAGEQRSPCSTFKIISSLIGLEQGAIIPGDSTHAWSGEIYWSENWNRDIDFEEAFRTSCVWYYREVIDEIGKETIQNELNRLQYGNCDISDWEGRLNTNNNNRALTGFWIESSLKISAMEQVQVLEQIFGGDSDYKPENLQQLRQVMLVTDNELEQPIYGKTGMGKMAGVVVDSWFTGFTDADGENIYFCIYLGETDNADVSSAKAKEIAIKIISDFYGNP